MGVKSRKAVVEVAKGKERHGEGAPTWVFQDDVEFKMPSAYGRPSESLSGLPSLSVFQQQLSNKQSQTHNTRTQPRVSATAITGEADFR